MTVQKRYVDLVEFTWLGLKNESGDPNTKITLSMWLNHFGDHPAVRATAATQRMFTSLLTRVQTAELAGASQVELFENEWQALVMDGDGPTQDPGEDFGWPVFAAMEFVDKDGQRSAKPVPSPRGLDLLFANALFNAKSEPRESIVEESQEAAE